MLKEKGFCKGVNLGGWMSQCDYSIARLDGFITEKDFEVLASWGIDHVRLPVDYDVAELMDDGISRIRRAVDMAESCGLNVMLDLHKAPGYSFDAGEQESGFFDNRDYQERFFRLWEKLAEEFDCCLCVDPEDIDAVAAAVRSLLDDPGRSRQMGERGYRAVMEKYSWANEEKKLLALYEELLK